MGGIGLGETGLRHGLPNVVLQPVARRFLLNGSDCRCTVDSDAYSGIARGILSVVCLLENLCANQLWEFKGEGTPEKL